MVYNMVYLFFRNAKVSSYVGKITPLTGNARRTVMSSPI